MRKYGQRGFRPPGPRGFTLVELLMVLTIMGILAVATVPMAGTLMVASGFDRAVGGIASTLQYARSYAICNNTYVYVGFREQGPGAAAEAGGTGRMMMAVIASGNGVRPDFSLWGTQELADNMVAVEKPQVFEGVHLASAEQIMNGTQMTSRPVASVDLGSATATTTFEWLAAGTRRSFEKVIEFDPRGVARLQSGVDYDTAITNFLEVPLLTAPGERVANNAVSMANQAAIQVDGVTGAVRVYRPD